MGRRMRLRGAELDGDDPSTVPDNAGGVGILREGDWDFDGGKLDANDGEAGRFSDDEDIQIDENAGGEAEIGEVDNDNDFLWIGEKDTFEDMDEAMVDGQQLSAAGQKIKHLLGGGQDQLEEEELLRQQREEMGLDDNKQDATKNQVGNQKKGAQQQQQSTGLKGKLQEMFAGGKRILLKDVRKRLKDVEATELRNACKAIGLVLGQNQQGENVLFWKNKKPAG